MVSAYFSSKTVTPSQPAGGGARRDQTGQDDRRRAARRRCRGTHHHRCAAGAAVRACVGEEVALALEAHAERRRHRRLAHHRQVVQGVVKAQRKTHHQQRFAGRHDLEIRPQVRWREGAHDDALR